MRQSKIQVAGRIKVANQMTLRWGIIVGYQCGPSVIAGQMSQDKLDNAVVTNIPPVPVALL